MSFPPNLFIIGAQKAGTTFLATLLDQHPDIALASPKETNFFTQHWDKGISWYRGHFSETGKKYLIDASPSYSAAPLESSNPEKVALSPLHGVPERIASISPESKFIYLLRDPVKRTYSSYWHSVRGGYEERPFNEVINDPYYLRMGQYYRQLELYLKHFSRDSFLIIFFEEFIKEPEVTANRCFSFLGLEHLDIFEMDRGKNETFAYGLLLSKLNKLLSPFNGMKHISNLARKVLPRVMIKKITKSMTKPIPPMTDIDREKLAKFFYPENIRIEKELGLTLPNWTCPENHE
ncbi:MAG: sulfotransferase [Sedimenticola sp.]